MNIEIKKSIKPINYFDAINLLEKRLEDLHRNNDKELIWTLEHNEIFTAGTSYKKKEILDNQCLKTQILPEDVSRMVLYLASDVSSGCTKQNFTVDGGLI